MAVKERQWVDQQMSMEMGLVRKGNFVIKRVALDD